MRKSYKRISHAQLRKGDFITEAHIQTRPTLYQAVLTFYYLISPAPDFNFPYFIYTSCHFFWMNQTISYMIKAWLWKSLSCCFNRLLLNPWREAKWRGVKVTKTKFKIHSHIHTASIIYHINKVPLANFFHQFLKILSTSAGNIWIHWLIQVTKDSKQALRSVVVTPQEAPVDTTFLSPKLNDVNLNELCIRTRESTPRGDVASKI